MRNIKWHYTVKYASCTLHSYSLIIQSETLITKQTINIEEQSTRQNVQDYFDV